jgi:diaminohydroxyphosphoribosylaminopyrimidine deaminase/5-amino-6-(5-phosphoribosylamino)uracil reductase
VQNAPFLKRVRLGLPFVTLKWAMSLDGKIATAAGESRWITSEEARRAAHAMRDRADAVLVGIGTALADDPELTTRIPGGRDAVRVVIDSKARLPLGSALIRSLRAKQSAAPVVVYTTGAAPRERIEALRAAGAEVSVVACAGSSRGVDPGAVARALASRTDRPVTNLLVEGGAHVHAAFLDAGLADRIAVFVAPKVIGGRDAPGPVAGRGAARLAEAIRVAAPPQVTVLGPDVLLVADVLPGGG